MHLIHELRHAFTRSGGKAAGLAFFVMVMMLFPLALPAGQTIDPILANAVMWITLCASYALSSRDLFDDDLECGALEQYALLVRPFSFVFFSKTAAHILLFTLPSSLIASALISLLNDTADPWRTAIAVFGGGCVCALLTAVTGALTAGAAKRSGLTSALLTPLLSPVMMFGAAYGTSTGTAHDDAPEALLVALLFLTPVCAMIGTQALKCHTEHA